MIQEKIDGLRQIERWRCKWSTTCPSFPDPAKRPVITITRDRGEPRTRISKRSQQAGQIQSSQNKQEQKPKTKNPLLLIFLFNFVSEIIGCQLAQDPIKFRNHLQAFPIKRGKLNR